MTRPRRRGVLRARLLALAIPAALGCYRLVPLAPDEVAGGREVSATLDERVRADYAWLLGPGVVRIDGTVAWARADSIRLLVRRTEDGDGVSVPWNGEPVTFARGELRDFAARRLDRRRSWLTVAGVGALAVLGAGAIGGGTSGDAAIPPGGEPPH